MSVYSYGPQGPDGQGYHSQGNRRADEPFAAPGGCKHSCRMRNPEREVGKSCFFLQIASQSHFSGAFEAENNENGCISALGLK